MGKTHGTGSGFRDTFVGLAGALAVTLGAAPAAGAPPVFGPASPLSSTAAIDAAVDSPPVLAAGANGTWIAAWESADSLGGTIGSDTDVLFARSADGGVTWSATAPLDPLAASDVAADGEPVVASDGHGTWVVVWRSNRLTATTVGDVDLYFSRSIDDGVTWSPAERLHALFASDSQPDDQPTLATDGEGGWVVAWRTLRGDIDLFTARSLDNGATWSEPVPLQQNAASDGGSDQWPALATDGNVWIAVWTSNDSLGRTIGTDQDILFARSTDRGLTWSAPLALHANAAFDLGQDAAPAVATDGAGRWLVAWQSSDSFGGTLGGDFDVMAARSEDGGVTWSEAAPVHAFAAGDLGSDVAPSVACSGPRRCGVAWQSNDSLGNTIGNDFDVLFAPTEDGGATWGAPAALDPRAALDTGADLEPVLVANGGGSWIAVWRSNDDFGGAIGTDLDPLVAIGLEPPVCGDGLLHLHEQCDDGNLLDGDGCRADCTHEVCGDARLDPGEECDDGNGVDGDGCRADCSAELCGDGIPDAGEECDDGNASSGDGCDATCRVEPAPAPPPPSEPQSLLEFFDASVADGTLLGTGRPSVARARLRLLRWWIGLAELWIEHGHRRASCTLLALAYERVDGSRRPHDLARGPAAPELALRIEELRESTGCHDPRKPRKGPKQHPR